MERKWESPNIHALPGAVWQHRSRTPGGEWTEPETQTNVPKQVVRSTQGDDGRHLISEYRPPANVGDKFYATLRKLGYQKGPGGDYQ